jgi:hypothetical protein
MVCTLNYETVQGHFGVLLRPGPLLLMRIHRLTAYVKQKAKSGCTVVAPYMGVIGAARWQQKNLHQCLLFTRATKLCKYP